MAATTTTTTRLLQRQLRALGALLDAHVGSRWDRASAAAIAGAPRRGASTTADDANAGAVAEAPAAVAAPSPAAADPSSTSTSTSSITTAPLRRERERRRQRAPRKPSAPPLALTGPHKQPQSLSSPSPSPRALLPEGDLFARLRAARSLADLELLLARHAASFRPPHVAAALAALPDLVAASSSGGGGAAAALPSTNRRARGARVARLLACQGLVRGGAAARISGTDAVACLRAMARLRCAPEEAVAALAERLAEREGAAVAGLRPGELAAASWALAVIERRGGGGWDEGRTVSSGGGAAAAAAAVAGPSGRLRLGAAEEAAAATPALLPPAPTLTPLPVKGGAGGGAANDASLLALAKLDSDEPNDALTTALLAGLPIPEPPPVPPRGRGGVGAVLPPPLPPLPPPQQQQQQQQRSQAAAGPSAADGALAHGQAALPALWRHLEDRARARAHSLAPNQAAALAWAFAATGRCRNGGLGARGGSSSSNNNESQEAMSAADYHAAVSLRARQVEEEEGEEEDEDGDDEAGAGQRPEEEEEDDEARARDGARPPSAAEPVNLLTALARSLLMRQHTITDPTAVARLLEAIALAAAAQAPPPLPPTPQRQRQRSQRHRPPPPPQPLPRAQRELALALGDRVAQLKAAFSPPSQLVGCLASLAAAGVPHGRAADAVGAMVAARLGPSPRFSAAANKGGGGASALSLPPSALGSSAGADSAPLNESTCLRGGWLPRDVPSYLSAAVVLAHSDPPALLACARALPAAAPHLSLGSLSEALEALVDLGLGRARGVEVAAASAGRGGGGGDAAAAMAAERTALEGAAAAVRAAVDRAAPEDLDAGSAARLLWAYALVWGDLLLVPTSPGDEKGSTLPASPPPPPLASALDAPLSALRLAEERGGSSAATAALPSPHELHRLYQAHRLLTEAWAEEGGAGGEKEQEGGGGGGGKWPARLVGSAAAAVRRRFGGPGKKRRGLPLPPRVQHACDLLSGAGLEAVASGAGADGGAIPVDVAVLLGGDGDEGENDGGDDNDGEETAGTPRLVAVMLDGPRSAARGAPGGGDGGGVAPGSARRRASNPPHALLGAAEADARLLTGRLGWWSVARLPWFEWDAAAMAAAAMDPSGAAVSGVRLRGGGSSAGSLQRRRRRPRRRGASAGGREDDDEEDDGGGDGDNGDADGDGDAALLAWVHNKVSA